MPQQKSDPKIPSSLTGSPRRRVGQRRNPYPQTPSTLDAPRSPAHTPVLTWRVSSKTHRGIRPSLPISAESCGISHPPLGQPGRRFQASPPSDLGRWQSPECMCVLEGGTHLPPRSFLGHHLRETSLAPWVEGARTGPAQLGRVFPGLPM